MCWHHGPAAAGLDGFIIAQWESFRNRSEDHLNLVDSAIPAGLHIYSSSRSPGKSGVSFPNEDWSIFTNRHKSFSIEPEGHTVDAANVSFGVHRCRTFQRSGTSQCEHYFWSPVDCHPGSINLILLILNLSANIGLGKFRVLKPPRRGTRQRGHL